MFSRKKFSTKDTKNHEGARRFILLVLAAPPVRPLARSARNCCFVIFVVLRVLRAKRCLAFYPIVMAAAMFP